jgi:hypothetical protein
MTFKQTRGIVLNAMNTFKVYRHNRILGRIRFVPGDGNPLPGTPEYNRITDTLQRIVRRMRNR